MALVNIGSPLEYGKLKLILIPASYCSLYVDVDTTREYSLVDTNKETPKDYVF